MKKGNHHFQMLNDVAFFVQSGWNILWIPTDKDYLHRITYTVDKY
ncbi:hypothetical protein [Bacillus cereus]